MEHTGRVLDIKTQTADIYRNGVVSELYTEGEDIFSEKSRSKGASTIVFGQFVHKSKAKRMK